MIDLNRMVYSPLGKGKQYCPVEIKTHIVKTATPKFAKMVSFKYIHTPAKTVKEDLKNNHNRDISQSYIQTLSQQVSNLLLKQEESFEYKIPKIKDNSDDIKTISIGLDGTCMPMGESNWREAMCGTISLFDIDGKRIDTTYTANAPEYGKTDFKNRMDKEILNVKKRFPHAKIVGVADGARENWKYLEQYTDINILDYYHATEYLSNVSKAFHPRSKNKQKEWLDEACNTLKNSENGAKVLLQDIDKLKDKNLSKSLVNTVNTTFTYFNNNINRMDYKGSVDNKLPIGSGVTESACKVIVKQRVCVSGANWSEYGAKRFLPMRAICITDGRWNQAWSKLTDSKLVA